MLASEFDHVIIGAHTLEQGAAFIEALLGVNRRPAAGTSRWARTTAFSSSARALISK